MLPESGLHVYRRKLVAVIKRQGGNTAHDLQGHVAVDGGYFALRISRCNGHPCICLLPYLQREQQCAQIRQAMLLSQRLATASAKNVLAMTALAANMHGHVFDHA